MRIALVGKYVELKDAYISITEALNHAGIFHDTRVIIDRVDSDKIEEQGLDVLASVDGILVAPGFGARGVAGKMRAIEYARTNRVPFLGICFGMQLSLVEFARNVCGLKQAMSTEVDPETPDPVVDFLPDQRDIARMGGSMRLGAYDCTLVEGTLAAKAYGRLDVSERHRHRYEFNNKYAEILQSHGLVFSGHHVMGNQRLVEMIELPVSVHPWFVATQAHPEFRSRPTRSSPLYRDFVGAVLSRIGSGKTKAGVA